MKPTAPIARQLQLACHDALPWLISFSLGDSERRVKPSIINTIQDYVIQQ